MDMLAFITLMANRGSDIKPYVKYGTITKEQYQEITGHDYPG